MAAYKGDHYVCTYHTGNSANTKSLEVYAKDDTDAKSKILIAYPNAQMGNVKAVLTPIGCYVRIRIDEIIDFVFVTGTFLFFTFSPVIR